MIILKAQTLNFEMLILTGFAGIAYELVSNSNMARKKMGGLTYSPITAFIFIKSFKYLIYNEELGEKECRHYAVKFERRKWFRRDDGGVLKTVPHDKARRQAGLER